MATLQYAPDAKPDSTFNFWEHGRIRFHDGPVERATGSQRAVIVPATHFLYEWWRYTVTCSGAVRLEVGSQTYAPIVDGVFQFQFENQLGLSRIAAFDANGSILDTRYVEVVSPKLGKPERSLAFLRAMLADLTSEQGMMAFMPRASTSRTVHQAHRPPSLLIQYFFLLNNAASIQDALHQVLRSPHRVLDDEAEHVSILDVTEIDADVVLQLVQGNAVFDQTVSPPRLKAAPDGVWFRVPREGYDSPENRFVRAVAASLGDACEDVLNASWLANLDDPGVVRRRETLMHLRNRLRQFWRAPIFDEVGRMYRVPTSSRVLQRRPGYRDLNLFWQAFLQSREPVWQRMQHTIDLRDIATLYEYWGWFALCREIQEAYDCKRPEVQVIPKSDPGLPQGLKAHFKGLGVLTYNASRKAYSGITLRPDYLWEPVQGRSVGFDAKFRLAWDAAPLDVAEDEEPRDPLARAKVDDLVKMHAYRDAIPGLRAALVLYPGHVAQFRSTGGEHHPDVTIAEVLMNELDGVGAIPMSPLGVNDE